MLILAPVNDVIKRHFISLLAVSALYCLRSLGRPFISPSDSIPSRFRSTLQAFTVSFTQNTIIHLTLCYVKYQT